MSRSPALFVTHLALLAFCGSPSYAQQTLADRVINVTFDTREPAGLGIDRGRLVWRDLDANSNDVRLKYFNGREIITLDSALPSVTAVIGRDHVAWVDGTRRVRVFDSRSWRTGDLASDADPHDAQPIAIAGNMVAFVRRRDGGSSEIRLTTADGSRDTSFSAAAFNREPSLHHGQIAWSAGDTDSADGASNIFLYDGDTTRNLSNTIAVRNSMPIVRDAHVAWLQPSAAGFRVLMFDGDTTRVLAETSSADEIIAGYDLSNGIAVVSIVDTARRRSTIRIVHPRDGTTTLSDSSIVQSIGIDNGMVWYESSANELGQPRMHVYTLTTGEIDRRGAAIAPVGDDGVFAWTFGDAVAMSVPVAYDRLTNGSNSDWPQTRFKNLDSNRAFWGNLDSSQFARLAYHDGAATRYITDSLVYKDFLMANDGVAIWRQDFNQLWMYDGTTARQLVDSLQCENMYVSGGHIGFFGFRIDAGNNINQAWLYDIAAGSLRPLSADTSGGNYIVIVDSGRAVWMRDSGGIAWMRYFDGTSVRDLCDSNATGKYGFRAGRIVWGELREGVTHVMMHDVARNETTQLTNSATDMIDPVTDGAHVAWFSAADSTMMYHDIASGATTMVTRWMPHVSAWLWMSNGRISWSSSDEVYLYDGEVVSQPTPYIFGHKGSAVVDREHLLWKAGAVDTRGDVYRSGLLAHAAFDVNNVSGDAPLDVAFANRSWGGASSYRWDFGDGTISAERSPTHRYMRAGRYDVTLTVTSPGNTSTERKIGIVSVRGAIMSTPIDARAAAPGQLRATCAPNPSTDAATVRFTLPCSASAQLILVDARGSTVASATETLDAGPAAITISTADLSDGMYYYRLTACGAVTAGTLAVHRR